MRNDMAAIFSLAALVTVGVSASACELATGDDHPQLGAESSDGAEEIDPSDPSWPDAITFGLLNAREVKGTVITFEFVYEGMTAYVVLNRSYIERKAPGIPPGTYRDLDTREEFTDAVPLKGRSYKVLFIEDP